MNVEELRQSVRDLWLRYYRDNRLWLSRLAVWITDGGKRRPSSSYILATLSVLEPRIVQLMPLMVDLSQDPDRVVDALGLNFNPEEELKRWEAEERSRSSVPVIAARSPLMAAPSPAQAPTLPTHPVAQVDESCAGKQGGDRSVTQPVIQPAPQPVTQPAPQSATRRTAPNQTTPNHRGPVILGTSSQRPAVQLPEAVYPGEPAARQAEPVPVDLLATAPPPLKALDLEFEPEPVSELVSEPVSESVSESVSEPASETTSETTSESGSESVTESGSESVSQAVLNHNRDQAQDLDPDRSQDPDQDRNQHRNQASIRDQGSVRDHDSARDHGSVREPEPTGEQRDRRSPQVAEDAPPPRHQPDPAKTINPPSARPRSDLSLRLRSSLALGVLNQNEPSAKPSAGRSLETALRSRSRRPSGAKGFQRDAATPTPQAPPSNAAPLPQTSRALRIDLPSDDGLDAERSDTERSDTERSDTERSGTERSGTARSGTARLDTARSWRGDRRDPNSRLTELDTSDLDFDHVNFEEFDADRSPSALTQT